MNETSKVTVYQFKTHKRHNPRMTDNESN